MTEANKYYEYYNRIKDEITDILMNEIKIPKDKRLDLPGVFSIKDKNNGSIQSIHAVKSLNKSFILYIKNNLFNMTEFIRHTINNLEDVSSLKDKVSFDPPIYIEVEYIDYGYSNEDTIYIEKIKAMKKYGLYDNWPKDTQICKFLCYRIKDAGLSLDTILELTESRLIP